MKVSQNSLQRVLGGFSLAVVTIFLVGCQHVNHLRDAQTSFNEAATAENKAKLTATFQEPDLVLSAAGTTIAQSTDPLVGYTAALLSLKEMPAKQRRQLKDDNLLSVALTLQALTEWKLRKYDDALTTIQEAERQDVGELYPRDSAIIKSIPALINIDLADAARLNLDRTFDPNMTNEAGILVLNTNSTNYAIFQTKIAPKLVDPADGAIAVLESARAGVPVDHEVNSFLIQSQLAAYATYRRAFIVVHPISDEHDVRSTAAFTNALEHVAELKELFDALNVGDAERNAAIRFWEQEYDLRRSTN